MYFLLLAVARKPTHGYEIMKAVTEISAGRVKLGAGTLYALLSRFEEDGIILCVGNDGRRKTYAITGKGQDILKAEFERLEASAAAFRVVLGRVEQ
jgi:DNA-binding PadR family transcriptional regulator